MQSNNPVLTRYEKAGASGGSGFAYEEGRQAYAQASGKEIPLHMAPRRPGDVAACWADASRAYDVLRWRAGRDLAQMCEDSWRWCVRSAGFNAGPQQAPT